MKLLQSLAIKTYSIINNTLQKLGWKLEYIGPHRYTWMKKIGIKTVLDVGANKGQSVIRRSHLLGSDIIFHCFEPLHNPFSILTNLYKNNKKIHLHNFGLGDTNSSENMHVSNIDDSSSLLAPSKNMATTYENIHFDKKETINIKRLDSIRSELKIHGPTLMKVDTQGFEGKVFDGAKESLKNIAIIVVELSFKEFYEGQPLFNEVCDQLFGYGFRYYGSFEQSGDPRDGIPMQQDAIFVNNTVLEKLT